MSMTRKLEQHRVLLGGIGGDAHTVGLSILRQALRASGYAVEFLGPQNELTDFFDAASLSDVVMLSSLDGHARHYLRAFPELARGRGLGGALWYLGGNLSIDDGIGVEGLFRAMGFHRVFPKFTDIREVLATLERDLVGRPVRYALPVADRPRSAASRIPHPVSDEPMPERTFLRLRAEVLDHWKTGVGARSLEDNARFLSSSPSVPALQARRNAGATGVLVQPRSGVSLVDDQIRLFAAFKAAGANVLSYQIDSLTRNNRYDEVELALRETRRTGAGALNGFPVVNHGVPALRRILCEVDIPLQTRHSTRDARLLAEISYAGGVTAYEGGAVCYNLPYYKDYPLDEAIFTWQYVDRLTGLYYERYGIVLDREFFGTLTAALIPPCIAIAVNIIQSILAVKQGVRSLSLGYAEQGNRCQDIAAIRMLGVLVRESLDNLGYMNVQVNTVFHQYMAAFPRAPERARQLIRNSAATAGLAGTTRMLTKTAVEAIKIPTLADNVDGLALVALGLHDAAETYVNEAAIADECALIRREVGAILEATILVGGGDLATGVVRAFESGVLDVPFSGSVYNRGLAVTGRDVRGAVRFLDIGALPFDRDVREFHAACADERRRAEGHRSRAEDYLIVERDVMQIAREEYDRWPLHEAASDDRPAAYFSRARYGHLESRAAGQ